jgi:LacI family transcriptional regulator
VYLNGCYFTSADKLAAICFHLKNPRGIAAPDMGLIGFSNSDLTELLDPPLSIIKQPAFEMGEVSMGLLLQLIESKRLVTEFETRVLSTELLIRGSTRKINAKTKVIA